MRTTATHPFLAGNYAPVPDETTVTDLRVEGRIPEALSGRFLRHGPNPVGDAPEPYHWFVGDGMVHGIHLLGGRAVSYRNRWVKTGPVSERLGLEPVGGPPQPTWDSSNTNVVNFGGRLLSITESALPYELTPDLETIGRVDFGGGLPRGMSAHPKVDPVTGELHVFSYWWEEPYLLYHVVSPAGLVTTTEPITIPAPVSMHDFAITRDHVVFFDQPAVFDLDLAMAGSAFPFSWRPEHGARVGVLPRGGTDRDVRWFDTEVCYTFHPLNAYDDGSSIVVDVPVTSSVFAGPGVTAGEEGSQTFERWTLDLAGGKVRQELLDDTPQEFCRIDDRRRAARHRYGYTIGVGRAMPYDATEVYKHDLDAGTRERHDFGPGRHPGEFVFVPDPDRSGDEDGGWLLGLVHDDAAARTSLVVLDAQDVVGPPVATVHVPRRIPYGFHAAWVPAA